MNPVTSARQQRVSRVGRARRLLKSRATMLDVLVARPPVEPMSLYPCRMPRTRPRPLALSPVLQRCLFVELRTNLKETTTTRRPPDQFEPFRGIKSCPSAPGGRVRLQLNDAPTAQLLCHFCLQPRCLSQQSLFTSRLSPFAPWPEIHPALPPSRPQVTPSTTCTLARVRDEGGEASPRPATMASRASNAQRRSIAQTEAFHDLGVRGR